MSSRTWIQEAARTAVRAKGPSGNPTQVRSADQVCPKERLGRVPSAGEAEERIRPREREKPEDRVRGGRQSGYLQRVAVVTLVSGVGVAPRAGILRKLLQPDDGVVGGAGRARPVEQVVGYSDTTPQVGDQVSYDAYVMPPTHPTAPWPAQARRAVAFSFLSGG